MLELDRLIHLFTKKLAAIRAGFSSSGLMGKILVLASGAVASRIIGFASVPVLTRLYTPEDFGVLGVFTATVALILPLGTLRYHVAVPLPKYDSIANVLVALSLILLVIVSILLGILFETVGTVLFEVFRIKELYAYRWWIICAVGATSFYEIMQFYCLRKGELRPIAITQMHQSFLGAFVKIGSGLLGFQKYGLIIGQVLQQAGGLVRLTLNLYKGIRFRPGAFSLKRLYAVAVRYKSFPLTRLPSQFLLIAAVQFPVILIGSSYGKEIAGQFALAFSTLAVPAVFVAQTVGSAYYSEISKLGAGRVQEVRLLTIAVLKRLSFVAIVPLGGVFLFGESLFVVVFGSDWRVAGQFSQALSIYAFFQLLATPVMHALTVMNKNGKFLMLNLVRTFVVIITFYSGELAGLASSDLVLAYSLGISLHYLWTTYVVINLLAMPR